MKDQFAFKTEKSLSALNFCEVITLCQYKNTSADNVLRKWDELELTDFIYEMYERYHIERLENAFDDIDALMLRKQNNLGTA